VPFLSEALNSHIICYLNPVRFLEVLLCGPLRISAFSAVKSLVNAEERRDTQRAAELKHAIYEV
jgi:hypothetical protein